MTKFIAILLIFILQLILTLTNYWFTFGLWPKSWTSFFLCGIASILLAGFYLLVSKED